MTARSQPPKKPTPAPQSSKEEEPLERELPRENAPELETPERPPADAPRSDEAELETPERPAVVVKERQLTEYHQALVDLPLLAQPESTDSSSEVSELLRHVSSAPVNSHAPVWLPHQPNSP